MISVLLYITIINLQVLSNMQFVNFVNSAIQFTKEYIMEDPKQLYLFNYMDPDYDVNWDDMESAEYDELLSLSNLSAEYDAYLDSLDE